MLNLQRLERVAARARSRLYAAGAPPVPDGERQDWFRIVAAADPARATVLIYGDIGGWWGVDAGQLVREVHALDVAQLDVHVNSQGGDMFDGFSIYAALRQHPATVEMSVDGVAASAASIIVMAGDTIRMEKPARLMVHRSAIRYASGNCDDLQELADLLRDFDASIAEVYADRSGGDPDAMLAAMAAETWYTATAALEAGLCDEIADPATGGRSTSAPETRVSQLIRARHRALMTTLGGVSTK